MSDLEAAIAAEMSRAGCERHDFDSDIPEVSSETTCEQHEAVWDEDRDACMVVAESVTAGWDAAINAAAEVANRWNRTSDRERNLADKHAGYHAGARDARMKCERELRALLPEGGNRE